MPSSSAPSGGTVRRNPAAVELHVDEVVLHGLPVANRHSLAGAVEYELERLLVERSWEPPWLSDLEVDGLDADGMTLPVRAPDGLIGRRLAEAIGVALDRALAARKDSPDRRRQT
jgi:hypothetical protein